MKSLFIGLVLAVSSMGCVSSNISGVVERNAARSDGFVTQMDAGTTTREREQDMLRAQRRAWHSLNLYYNDKPLPADVQKWVDENAEEE